MPRYFFNVYHDRAEPDEEGEELPDMQAAWREATVTAGQIIQDLDGKLRPRQGLAARGHRQIRKSAIRHSRQRQPSQMNLTSDGRRVLVERPAHRMLDLFGALRTGGRQPTIEGSRGLVCDRRVQQTIAFTARGQACGLFAGAACNLPKPFLKW